MWWHTLIALIPLALVAGVVVLILALVIGGAMGAVARSNQEELVRISEQHLTTTLGSLYADARYLARQQILQQWISTGDEDARAAVGGDYVAFAEEKGVYDQIRYIDIDGREQVRVNWNGGHPAVVPASHLQDKADRYYVNEVRDLERGQVYVSRFDLNLENGAIEQPRKPVIRFGAPVYDRNGARAGTVFLNYLGAPLLDRIQTLETNGLGHLWILNRDGYWLVGPTPDDEWAFMYPDRAQRSMAVAYPQVWARIRGADELGRLRRDGALFTYVRAAPEPKHDAADQGAGGSGPVWYVVSYVPPAIRAAALNGLLLGALLAYVAVVVLLSVVAVMMARQRLRRQEAEASLRASDTRFRHLVEAAPDGIVIADVQGRIEVVNAQAEHLFGHRRESLLGKSVEMLLPERYREAHAGYRASYEKDPRLRPMGQGLKLNGLRSDGSEFPVEISLSPVMTEGRLLVLADVRDVTERRAQERRIQELNTRLTRDNAELEAVNHELEAFSYSVSHDLRAPLRAIDGFSQALLEDCAESLDDAGRGYLERVRQAAQRMGMLIDDLLRLSRVARSQLDVQDVDATELVNDIVAQLRSEQPDRDVDVQVEDGLQAHADPRLLRIALENLIGNAWKFTGGRDRARIAVGRSDHEGTEALYVHDNGVGFDMQYADQLFRAFQRLHDGGEFPGTGIGLATVHRIVNKHGGRIWAEAEPDRGATFFLSI